GGNFRMDAIQAAVLRVKAPHLAAWTEARRMNAQRYVRLFRERGMTDRVVLPVEPAGLHHTYHQFVIRVADRDGLKAHLDAKRTANALSSPRPFHLRPFLACRGYRRGAFPQAEGAPNDSLAIPISPELTIDQQHTIVDAIAEFGVGPAVSGHSRSRD